MKATTLFIIAVCIALFGVLIASHSELWGWAYIPAVVSLGLYFAASWQHDRETS